MLIKLIDHIYISEMVDVNTNLSFKNMQKQMPKSILKKS